MRAGNGSERGAALLVAMVALAVLTAMAVNLAYESQVSLRIAAHGRDELRAAYRARSGVTLSRLVLSLQQTIDEIGKGAVPGNLPAPRVQLWRAVSVGPELAEALFPPDGAAPPGAPRLPDFAAEMGDEALKANAQLEALGQGSSGPLLAAQVRALYQLVCEPRWDPLFEREDANGIRISREDLLVHLRDWVDWADGDRTSGLVATFGGTSCAMVPAQFPFENAYGDENQPYQRGDDRYRAKNARMDSLDELFLVAGVGDAFMAAFGDALTVYLPRDAKRNVNEIDRDRLVELATILADPPGQVVLHDARFPAVLHELVMKRTYQGLLSLSVQDFGRLVQETGLQINANLLAENGPFTDRSTTFRIRASGQAGDVAARISAVVRLEKPQPGQPAGAPGRIIHWKEE